MSRGEEGDSNIFYKNDNLFIIVFIYPPHMIVTSLHDDLSACVRLETRVRERASSRVNYIVTHEKLCCSINFQNVTSINHNNL